MDTLNTPVEGQGTAEPQAAAQPVAPEVLETPRVQPRAAASKASSGGPAIWAVGRRKESVARVRLIPGTGDIRVNGRTYDDYFPRENLRLSIRQPLLLTQQLGKQSVIANIAGGGLTGQADALRLGIARALVELDPSLRAGLREAGLLTRDPRAKERKKYGQEGARKRFQWTKR